MVAVADSIAEPLDPYDEHQLIWRVDEQGNQALRVRAETEHPHWRWPVTWLVRVPLVSNGVGDHNRVEEPGQLRPHRLGQSGELVQRRSVQLPGVHALRRRTGRGAPAG